MRIRTVLVIAALTTGALLPAFAGPAAAKIAVRGLSVTGPGLADPILLGTDDAWSFLVSGGSAPDSPPAAVDPDGPLGPRYVIRVETDPSVGHWTLRLHPFAADGPVLWFGHVQELRWMIEWSERPEHTGWIAVAPAQLDVLHRHGLPRSVPVEGVPPATPQPDAEAFTISAKPAASEGRSTFGAPIAIGFGAAGLTLLGARRLARRRVGDG